MGEKVSQREYSRKERTGYREKLLANLETFDKYLQEADFADEGTIGLEMEINLAAHDAGHAPALRNIEILEQIDDEEFQSEIGAYNIELNYPAIGIGGTGLAEMEEGLNRRLKHAQNGSQIAGVDLVTVGILPTLGREFFDDPEWMSPQARYSALNHSVLEARGEDVRIDIRGEESVQFYAQSVAPEAACTSVQLHLQVAPQNFAAAWNASQAIAGPQVALAANSPIFVGKRLWQESRIPVFTQAIDTRSPELVNQGVRPRVWFGERWVTSIFDLFEENVRYFPALIPESADAAGAAEFAASGAPKIHELMLHNGTVWRWNRPIYFPGDNGPHLRVENRLLPAGPTVTDTVANAAFYYGLVKRLSEDARPVWSRMSFGSARENFFGCARTGLDSHVYWPKVGTVPVDELILKRLLPMAREGLEDLGVDGVVIDTYLGILHDRALTGRNGARWQLDTLEALENEGRDRPQALAALMALYVEHQWSNVPVHEWPVPGE